MPERCVDASLAIKWVIKGETWRKRAREFLRDPINSDFALIAPPYMSMKLRVSYSNDYIQVH